MTSAVLIRYARNLTGQCCRRNIISRISLIYHKKQPNDNFRSQKTNNNLYTGLKAKEREKLDFYVLCVYNYTITFKGVP